MAAFSSGLIEYRRGANDGGGLSIFVSIFVSGLPLCLFVFHGVLVHCNFDESDYQLLYSFLQHIHYAELLAMLNSRRRMETKHSSMNDTTAAC